MYDVKSSKAEEFISDEEILDTLDYAEKNKSNKELIEALLQKAASLKGLTHREAAVLLGLRSAGGKRENVSFGGTN